MNLPCVVYALLALLLVSPWVSRSQAAVVGEPRGAEIGNNAGTGTAGLNPACDSVQNNVEIATDQVFTGVGSIKATGNTGGAPGDCKTHSYGSAQTEGWHAIKFRFDTANASNIMRTTNGPSSSVCFFEVNSSRQLVARHGTVTDTGTTALALDTWHSLSFHCVGESGGGGNGIATVRLDGTVEATVTTGDEATATFDGWSVQQTASGNMWFDDAVTDDATFPNEDIRVLGLVAEANGAEVPDASWAAVGGSPCLDSAKWDCINSIPLPDFGDFIDKSDTASETFTFALDLGQGTGSPLPSGSTIVAFNCYHSCDNPTGGSPSVVSARFERDGSTETIGFGSNCNTPSTSPLFTVNPTATTAPTTYTEVTNFEMGASHNGGGRDLELYAQVCEVAYTPPAAGDAVVKDPVLGIGVVPFKRNDD